MTCKPLPRRLAKETTTFVVYVVPSLEWIGLNGLAATKLFLGRTRKTRSPTIDLEPKQHHFFRSCRFSHPIASPGKSVGCIGGVGFAKKWIGDPFPGNSAAPVLKKKRSSSSKILGCRDRDVRTDVVAADVVVAAAVVVDIASVVAVVAAADVVVVVFVVDVEVEIVDSDVAVIVAYIVVVMVTVHVLGIASVVVMVVAAADVEVAELVVAKDVFVVVVAVAIVTVAVIAAATDVVAAAEVVVAEVVFVAVF